MLPLEQIRFVAEQLVALAIPYDDGGINMILLALAIWSLMKQKLSREVTVAAGLGRCGTVEIVNDSSFGKIR